MSIAAHARQFEDLVAAITESAGYVVQREVRAQAGDSSFYFDLIFRSDGDRMWVGEVKWTYRSPVPLGRLRDWAARLATYVRTMPEARAVLIVSGETEEAHRDWISQEFNVEVWDRERLLALARDRDDLTSQFLDLDRLAREIEAARAASAPRSAEPPQPPAPPLPPSDDGAIEPPPPNARGQALIAALAAVRPGREDAAAYERVCVDVIDYLFGDHLVDARAQAKTEDGLNIFDVIYRVRTGHSFWTTLTRDFRARVVMFEFKNYTNPPGPQQVFTTERYLSSAAMRSVCFVLSRQPPHPHAEVAAFGSLREGGKLIVFLSDADLITMLKFRDAEVAASEDGREIHEDPSVVLDQKIYQLLATVGR